ncbi:MAG: Gfo/Idh/MocA family oxidoreductase [Ahrensia sp.]
MIDQSKTTFNWGIVGPGTIAEKFAEDLVAVPGAARYAVCSRDEGRAAAFAQTYGFAKHFGDMDAFLADDALDIVYIATPHPFHVDQAIAAIEAGKAVLIEKPITMTADEARRIEAATKASNVFVMEALWSRFLPAIQRAKAIVDSGQLGPVIRAEGILHFHRPFEAEHRLFNPATGGGVLLDLGVYPLSIARFLLGPMTLESAQWRAAPTGVDKHATLTLKAAAGPVSIRCGFEEDRADEGDNTFTIFGEKQTLRIDRHFLRTESVTVWDKPRDAVPSARGLIGRVLHKSGLGTGKTQRFARSTTGLNFQAAAVQYALANGMTSHPTMPLHQSIEVMKIIEAALAHENRV